MNLMPSLHSDDIFASIATVPNEIYVLEECSHLSAWFPIATNTATQAILEFKQSISSLPTFRIYRAAHLKPGTQQP